MASPRGPYRYDKDQFNERGGLSPYGCEGLLLNRFSADGVDTNDWFKPKAGNLVYIKPPGWRAYAPIRLTSAIFYGTYYSLGFTSETGLCTEDEPRPGPITEWFVSWYNPAEEPPYDETTLSVIGSNVVDAPTTPSNEVGSWCPALGGMPPYEALYQDAAGQTVSSDIQAQGLGHLIAVNDYDYAPPLRRLFVCTEFETLDPSQDENAGSEPPFVLSIRWTPVYLDYPKIDPATGKPNDPWSLWYSNNDITDLATDV